MKRGSGEEGMFHPVTASTYLMIGWMDILTEHRGDGFC
jgi:hypothetical protein